MKCPECGQWNRASMPHCLRCGAPLNIDAAANPEWKESLRDEGPSSSYIRVDETGEPNTAADSRDILAREMQDLKKRKKEGAEKQRRLRQNINESRGIIAREEEPGSSGESHIGQGQTTTIRMKRISPGGIASEQESAFRHKVRFLDETGSVIEQRVYDPFYSDSSAEHRYTYSSLPGKLPSRSRRRKIFFRIFLSVFIAAALITGGYFTYRYFTETGKSLAPDPGVSVTATMMDDLAAHTIRIPGSDGSQIYIRELHASYIVTDGYATIQVADHTWYDNYTGTLAETMDVTLTPFLKTASGKQTPLAPVTYTIFIPLSPITLDSPDSLRTVVATTMSTIKITVRPGSKVTVNDVDCSDTVSSDTGEMSYNATVHPQGDNTFIINVRSQYCRDNSITVTLYREPQEIPLDMAVGTYGTTYERVIKISATTLPGAHVEVSSPHTDLDITNLDSTGKFSFNAVFDHIGDNTIVFSAAYPGKKTSVVEHTVYYVPPASEYTVKAWPLTPEGYSELLSNLPARAKYGQVYVVTGIVQYSVSDKPQMVVINTSADGKSQPVLVQNFTKTKWEVGQYYRIYADVTNTYNSMPWLNARYTYTN